MHQPPLQDSLCEQVPTVATLSKPRQKSKSPEMYSYQVLHDVQILSPAVMFDFCRAQFEPELLLLRTGLPFGELVWPASKHSRNVRA